MDKKTSCSCRYGTASCWPRGSSFQRCKSRLNELSSRWRRISRPKRSWWRRSRRLRRRLLLLGGSLRRRRRRRRRSSSSSGSGGSNSSDGSNSSSGSRIVRKWANTWSEAHLVQNLMTSRLVGKHVDATRDPFAVAPLNVRYVATLLHYILDSHGKEITQASQISSVQPHMPALRTKEATPILQLDFHLHLRSF